MHSPKATTKIRIYELREVVNGNDTPLRDSGGAMSKRTGGISSERSFRADEGDDRVERSTLAARLVQGSRDDRLDD
jgi:hypothetical protein